MKQKQKNDYLDDLIENACKDNYNRVEIDDERKEQQWNELMSELDQMNKRSKPKKWHTLLATISACILLLFSLSFFQTESGSAFGWLKKIFVEEDGVITRVQVVTEEEKAKNENLGPTINSALELTKTEIFPTIEEAKKEINKKIFTPSYLPESTNLLEVRISYQSDDSIGKIQQIYSYENEIIKIIQKSNNFESAYHYDNEDSLISQELPIDANGVFINYKDEINKLMWTQEQYTFTIEANLNQDNIVKIAQSFK